MLTFTSDSVFTYVDTMYFNYSDTVEAVVLNAISIGAPILDYSPLSITDTVFNCGDSVVIPVTVYNNGEGDLNGNIYIYDYQNGGSNGNAFYEGFESGNLDNWEESTSLHSYSIVNTNPAVGNSCLRSYHTNYGYYTLKRDFEATEDYVRFRLKSDYSSSYNSGGIAITSSSGSTSIFSVNKSGNNYRIFNGGSTIYHPISNHNEWTTFEFKNIDYVTRKFDLYINEVLVNAGLNFYSSYSTPTQMYIYSGSSYNYQPQYYDDIQVGEHIISDWAYASTDTMSVVPGDSLTFDVVLTSEDLIAGNYDAILEFSSNDPNSELDTLPISFTVIGSPVVSQEVTCIDYGSQVQFTSTLDSFMLYNTGCDTLFLSNLQTALPDFTAYAESDTVRPWDTTYVYVTYTPATVSSFIDTLVIDNNDTTVYVCLTASSTGAPEIDITPDNIIKNITTCTDSVDIEFWVHNVGYDTLVWEMNSGASYSDDFEGTSLNSFWTYNSSANISTICGAASGSKALRFMGYGQRQIQSQGIAVNVGSSIDLKIKKGTGSSSGTSNCETPDSGENIRLAYSLNNGVTWIDFHTFYSSGPYSSFTQQTVQNSGSSFINGYKV